MQLPKLRNLTLNLSPRFFNISSILVLAIVIHTIQVNAWIGDDAQITFRQIWNFITGDGITFNFGERVQAFTHPLWFLLLSFFVFVTQELFLTTIIISAILSLLSVLILMKIEFDKSNSNRTLLSPVIFFVFSWAFCDFTTSGLENPLSYLLTALLIYLISLDNWKQELQKVFIVLSLLVLNRFDYVVLFFPLVLYLVWNCQNVKQLLRVIWPGTLLLVGWFLFATIYFGFPLPNTFYAKLNTGYPIDELLIRGWNYLISMSDDLASVLIILIGLVFTLVSRNKLLICLTVGQFLYCLYLLRAGGDFMLGRHFALFVLISVGQIILSLSQNKNLSLLGKNILIIGIFVVLFVIGLFERYPFRSHIETESRRPLVANSEPASHIVDERSHYRFIFGLDSDVRDSWPKVYKQVDQQPTDYRTTCGILGGSSLADPNIFLIDVCGLSDPLISRLPAIQVSSWRIGHHLRKMPENYGEFKLGKISTLNNKHLTKLAIDLRKISSDDIFGIERFKAIWRINTGFYSDIDFNKYSSPSIYIPFSSSTEIVELDNWDSEFEYENLAPIYGTFLFKYFASNIKFQSKESRISDGIEIHTNTEFTYKVYVNNKLTSVIQKVKQDKVVGGNYRRIFIPLKRRTRVKSVELRAIDAHYVGDTSINAIFHLNVIEPRDLNQWVMPAGGYENHQYSWLDQINKQNADQLQVAWTFSTGSKFNHHGSPLVVDDIMYVHTFYPNVVYALDLNNSNQILWKYESRQDLNEVTEYCCGNSNYGLTYAYGRILFHQPDSVLVSLDAYTGKLIWRIETGKQNMFSVASTTTPLVVDDKVFVGISADKSENQGHISAYNIWSGELIWRAYSTGHDQDMLIEPFKTTVLGESIGKNSGLKSWDGNKGSKGNIDLSKWFSFDQEEKLIYYGTGRSKEDDHSATSRSKKWTNTIFARNLNTGIVKWLYQVNSNENMGFDNANEMILTERTINGKTRKLLVYISSNGFVYTLDRVSGELIQARKFDLSINWATKIDLDKNSINYGFPIVDESIVTGQVGNTESENSICPSILGSKSLHPASYSPESMLFFVPTNNLCMDSESFTNRNYADKQNFDAKTEVYPPRKSHNGFGNLIAWDNINGEIEWSIPEKFPIWSGALSTGGGIVVYGTLDSYLKIVDSKTGENLFKFKTSSGITGNVMSYLLNGRQYIAVYSGIDKSSFDVRILGDIFESTKNVDSISTSKFLDQFSVGGQVTVFSLPNNQNK